MTTQRERRAESGRATSKIAAGRIRLALVALVLPLCALAGQDAKIRQQRAELDRIRMERTNLEHQMRELQTTLHGLSEEVGNLARRADATARIVKTLDRQLATIGGEVAEATHNMTRAESELAQKKVILRKRVVDIYKRGPMYTTEALLSAQSFGELVARYKYLHLLALRDRALVRRVEQLRNQVALERDRLLMLERSLRDSREEKQLEENRLRSLEQQERQQLLRVRHETRQTQNKIARARLTETQLSNTIAALESERRRAEASRPASARVASTIRTSDYGRLEWPVEGRIVYTYGRAMQPNNTAIRWNGVGIQAVVGTPVRSVASGRVVSAKQLGTYGLTVIVDHGGGDYSVYGSLSHADVRNGQNVARGQTIGGVGISDPELPAHLHFEIRHGGPAMDPAAWLRKR